MHSKAAVETKGTTSRVMIAITLPQAFGPLNAVLFALTMKEGIYHPVVKPLIDGGEPIV